MANNLKKTIVRQNNYNEKDLLESKINQRIQFTNALNKQCKISWLPSCHVKQRDNRLAIDSIGQETGVILIDCDYPKLIHTIVILIARSHL